MVPHKGPYMVPHKAPDMVPHKAPDMVPHKAPDMVPHKAPDMVPHKGPDMVPPDRVFNVVQTSRIILGYPNVHPRHPIQTWGGKLGVRTFSYIICHIQP